MYSIRYSINSTDILNIVLLQLNLKIHKLQSSKKSYENNTYSKISPSPNLLYNFLIYLTLLAFFIYETFSRSDKTYVFPIFVIFFSWNIVFFEFVHYSHFSSIFIYLLPDFFLLQISTFCRTSWIYLSYFQNVSYFLIIFHETKTV